MDQQRRRHALGFRAKFTLRMWLVWLFVPFLVSLPSTVAAEDPVPAEESRAAPHRGTLLAGGGGTLPDTIYDKFASIAGGASGRLVLIPTATTDDAWLQDPVEREKYLEDWRQEGIPSVSILHTRERDQANDPDFVQPLTTATAVWFGGGDQAFLEQAYVGTLVEREVQGVLSRGGIVGGSSAGAAIQSRVMIRCGDDHPEIGTGFELIPGTILDQHFLRRSRVNRLFEAVRQHPNRIGVGIDEGTAILVQNGQFEVLGESYVMLVRMGPDGHTPRIQIQSAGETTQLGNH